jgi:hypothetical protein
LTGGPGFATLPAKEKPMQIYKAAAIALLALAPAWAAAESVFDGTWMPIKEDKTVDLNAVVTYKVGRESVEMSALSGVSYKAKLNGADAPVSGDLNTTSVSVTMPRKNVLLEVSKREGKPWLTTRIEVDAGGKTAKVSWKNMKTDKGGAYEMAKQ